MALAYCAPVPGWEIALRTPDSSYNPDVTNLTLDSVVQIASGVMSATVAGEVVILEPVSARYYGVEGAGVDIWEMLREQRVVRDLHERLLEIYDVDPERCERDLLAILLGLLEDGLIEVLER